MYRAKFRYKFLLFYLRHDVLPSSDTLMIFDDMYFTALMMYLYSNVVDEMLFVNYCITANVN